jgi:putative ABC transport system ATP-binding protein
MTEPPPLLQIDDLRFQRGNGDQAFNVEIPSLQLQRGELLALTGESGSGKSTVLELLGLVARPLPGAGFHWHPAENDRNGIDIAALWHSDAQGRLAALRASSIGYVMQTGGLLPFLSVWENLIINRRLLGMNLSRGALDAIIEPLEIAPLLDKLPRELSVGQQQRVAIGRALAHQPALLLADEPTSALDPRLADQVLQLLLALAAEFGVTAVIATHEHQRVRDLGLREVTAQPGDGTTRFGSRLG